VGLAMLEICLSGDWDLLFENFSLKTAEGLLI
jgi:hypothetical protein